MLNGAMYNYRPFYLIVAKPQLVPCNIVYGNCIEHHSCICLGVLASLSLASELCVTVHACTFTCTHVCGYALHVELPELVGCTDKVLTRMSLYMYSTLIHDAFENLSVHCSKAVPYP